MTISRFLDFFRASGNEPGEANIAARRRFLLGAGAAMGAMLIGSGTGFVGSARAEPGGAIGMDDIRERQRNRQNQRRHKGRNQRHGYRPRPRQYRPSTAELCRNDWRFRRNNPGLCHRYTTYRPRRRDRLCIDLGPITICE